MTVGQIDNEPRKSQVEEELNNLGLSLSELSEIIIKLHDRLSPVLRTEAEGKGGTEATESHQQLVPLADSIREKRYVARALEGQIRELIESLEL